MQADCSAAQLHFEGFGKRQVVGAFDGGAVTSNAGAILLREADRALGLTAKVARCLVTGVQLNSWCTGLRRWWRSVCMLLRSATRTSTTMTNCGTIRYSVCCRTRSTQAGRCVPLAGKSTLNRLEHGLKSAMSRYHKISVIDAAMEEVFLELYAAAQRAHPNASSSTSMRRTIRCTAARKAVSSTAIIAATATSRSTSSTGATCSLLSSGRPISTPRLARRRRSRASCRTCVRPGRRWRSG